MAKFNLQNGKQKAIELLTLKKKAHRIYLSSSIIYYLTR